MKLQKINEKQKRSINLHRKRKQQKKMNLRGYHHNQRIQRKQKKSHNLSMKRKRKKSHNLRSQRIQKNNLQQRSKRKLKFLRLRNQIYLAINLLTINQWLLIFRDYFCSELLGIYTRQRLCHVVIPHKKAITQ